MFYDACLHVVPGDDMGAEVKSTLRFPLDDGAGLWGY